MANKYLDKTGLQYVIAKIRSLYVTEEEIDDITYDTSSDVIIVNGTAITNAEIDEITGV